MDPAEEGSRPNFHGPADYLKAACDPSADAELLHQVAQQPYPFVRQAVAEHPAARPETLHGLVPDLIRSWNDHRLVLLITRHPSASAGVLARVAAVAESSLIAGNRPYEICAALAERGVLAAADAARLRRLPGASARFRHRMARAVVSADPAHPNG